MFGIRAWIPAQAVRIIVLMLASVSLIERARGELVLTVTASPGAFSNEYRDSNTLTIEVKTSNTGNIAAINVVLTTVIPMHWGGLLQQLYYSELDGGVCSNLGTGDDRCYPGNSITWDLGDLIPGQSRAILLATEVHGSNLPAVGTRLDNSFRARATNSSDVTANAQVVVGDPATAPASVTATSSGAVFPPALDSCPNDPNKTAPGQCGCGTPDTDSDGDGTPDCNDGCPNDSAKTGPGNCGCGNPEDCGGGHGGGPIGFCGAGIAEAMMLSLGGLMAVSICGRRRL